jgi:hypothetical protein
MPEVDLKFLYQPLLNLIQINNPKLNKNKNKLEFKKTLITNEETFHYNHGDDKILEHLRAYQLKEEIKELSFDDIKKVIVIKIMI